MRRRRCHFSPGRIMGGLEVILLDTCALIFDALTPKRLSKRAARTIEEGDKTNELFCSDISLWEIAMLIEKGRLSPGSATDDFLRSILDSRGIKTLPITPSIAYLSASYKYFEHNDPADRIIAATALSNKCPIITSDSLIKRIKGLNIIW